MTERIFIKEIGRIKKVRAEIEKGFNVNLIFTREGIEVEGKEGELNEYVAIRAIEALGMGFNINAVLKLKEEDYMLEIVNIKKNVRDSRVETVKGRIIGKKGKALESLSELTDCMIRLNGNDIGIIGKTFDVKFAVNAVLSLIHGSPHSNVYAYLEKSRHLREIKEEEQETFMKKGSL